MRPSPARAAALHRLSRAVATSPAVPCAGRDDWTSDIDAERAAAALLCSPCPVLAECRAAGLSMSFGIWAGLDRKPPRGTK